MIKTTLKIEGMLYSMCENHINEIIRNNFTVKKVKSSAKNAQTEILSEETLDTTAIKNIIEKLGYKVALISQTEYKKIRFHLLKRKA